MNNAELERLEVLVGSFAEQHLTPGLHRELRSDHAGETGAVWIYRGILKVSGHGEVCSFAQAHLRTERAHLAFFERWLPGHCHSILLPLWRLAGFMLGAFCALFGPRTKPRVNLTRFHGVFAPNSKFRVRVTPAKRGRGRTRRQPAGENWQDKTPAERHASMTWMQRLKRVFNIDPEAAPSRPASDLRGRSRSLLVLKIRR